MHPIQSARLRTSKSFSFKYGRVEIRAQMSRGDWLWPGNAKDEFQMKLRLRYVNDI